MKISTNVKKSLPTKIPRISTRGYYDLATGRRLKNKPYDLYPKSFFKNLGNYPEFTIVIHGMRNNKQGALEKFKIVQKRLRQLGYKHPVVGFSYDSNVKGIQYKSYEYKAAKVARLIAKKNGLNLAKFILNIKRKNPTMRIQVMGHSLGTEVIAHVLPHLYNKQKIDQVYFFGSSLPVEFLSHEFNKIIQKTLIKKIINYYNPTDLILKTAHESGIIKRPIGYFGLGNISHFKLSEKKVITMDHKFASYVAKLTSI
ncbi:MAG: DUF726 domain-containing protein [Candidatus Nitrosotenuis sp.]